MTLDAYLKSKGLSEREFAERIGMSQRAVNSYVRGDRRPRWAVVVRIAQATGNAVTALDWAQGIEKKEHVAAA